MLVVKNNSLILDGKVYRCAIGKSGFSSDKREGDGCTPIGTFALRECWYRLDRLPPPVTGLPRKIIHKNDGWSDDPKATSYNTHVILPYSHSHEKLWREDHVYDLIVALGYNDDPVVAGRGSAIFMHLAKPDYAATEGCIALAQQDLLDILPDLSIRTQIKIHAN